MFKDFLLNKYSEKVAKSYLHDFESFESYLAVINKKAVDVQETDILAYIQSLRDENYSPSTINKRLSLLRNYFKYLRSQNLMIHNPMDNIQQSKFKSEPFKLNSSDYQTITDILLNITPVRDKLIFHLIIEEGIKPSQIIQITRKDINLETGMLFTEKKAIPLQESTITCFKEMCFSEDQTFLFTNQHGHPLKESGIYFVIKNYLNLIGYEKLKPAALAREKSM